MNVKTQMQAMGIAARKAATQINKASTQLKNSALVAIANQITAQREFLLAENQKDLAIARENGISDALLDRLTFTDARFDSMVEGCLQVAKLDDPIGQISDMSYRPNGLQIGKMRAPLGVIGIIYESRPNVTVDAASLCLKSGNAVILRGGSESIHSNRALAQCIEAGLESVGLPKDVVQLVPTTDRAAVGELITMNKYIDVIIPRGGLSLTSRIATEATIPVIKHLDGNCHVYIDETADRRMAIDIAFNAKCNRYAVCNAMETLLIAEPIAPDLLPELAAMYQQAGVELRGCEKTTTLLSNLCTVLPATEDDWYTEYVAPILAIKVVAGVEDAIAHINHYGSKHTDVIVTESHSRGQQFLGGGF